MKEKLIYIYLVLLILSLSACSLKEDIFLSQDTAVTVDKTSISSDKTFVLTSDVDLDTMDPQLATDGFSFGAIAAICDGLYTTDINGNIIPALAQKTDITKDGLIYTFHLRDAVWSNGVSVTAYDFVYGWRRLADPALNCEYNYMLEVAGIKNSTEVLNGIMPVSALGIKAVDDKTLVVTLDRPVTIFVKLMLLPSFFPVNQEFAEAHGEQFGKSPESTLCNGAFEWTTWILGKSLEFRKNSTYWDAQTVKIDGLKFMTSLTSRQAVSAFENGISDLAHLTGELIDVYKDNKEYHHHLNSYVWWLQLNHTTGKFDNINLNKAIALAFNREQIANSILKDGSIPAYYFVPQKLLVDSAGNDFRTLVGDYYTESKEQAKQYWDKAKEELAIDTLSIELLFDDSETTSIIAHFIKSELETTLDGINIKLKSLPKGERLTVIRGDEADYDMALTGWGADYADPMTFLELYAKHPDGELGRGGYNNLVYNELIDSAKSGTLTETQRIKTMAMAERILLESGAGPIPVYQTSEANLWNSKITGLYHNLVGVKYIYKWVDITS